MPQLLLPVNGFSALASVINSGADAVYMGFNRFSARAGAVNFSLGEMIEAIKICHKHGVKSYVALNTLLNKDEYQTALELLAEAYNAGADAVILQDLNLAKLCREYIPDLPRHASTQCSALTIEDVKRLKDLGFSRVVLGRELSVAEISEIIKAVPDIETEVFIHGALCRSVSGKCYLSKALGGRSADRGECASPCRLPFCDERGRRYCLSLKDNCALPVLAQLAEIGVTSFKVEGRQKRAEYACAAGLVYRKAIDGADYAEELELLKRITPGVQWTCGYLDGTLADMINYSEHYSRTTADTERAAKEIMACCRLTRDSVPVQAAFACKRNAPTVLTLVDEVGNNFTAEGDIPQAAEGAGLDSARAESYIGKLGGEPYYISEFCADIDDGLFVSAAVLNGLRRECAKGLTDLRTADREFTLGEVDISGIEPHKTPKYLMMMRNIPETPKVVTDSRGREFKVQGEGKYTYLI